MSLTLRAGAPDGVVTPTRAPAGLRLLFGPAWPLTSLLALYPLWWALGLGVLIFPLMAVPMAWQLYRRHAQGLPVRLPPAFWIWLAFCTVTVVGFGVLDVDPAGTISATFAERITAPIYKLVQHLALTVLLVYAGNLSAAALPQRRLVNLLAWMFAVTVAGGLLGTFAGHFEFTSPVELLLPDGVRGKGFVKSLVHPYAAQIMDLVGDPLPRPAAPWGYTNTWGNNFCLLVVWFVAAVFAYPSKPRTRLLAVGLLAVSIVPVVHSLNRGLWIGLGATAVFIAVRQALAGRLRALVALGVVLAGLAVALATTPLGGVIERRLDNGKSNGVRMFLTERAVEGVADSPVLGFGSTRSTQGGRQSIAVGESAACERCGNFTVGGNGQLWQLLYAHGLAGTLTYFGFFGYALWRFRRDRSALGLAASAAIAGSFVAALWYNSLVTPLAFTFLGYVVLWRNSRFQIASSSVEPVGHNGHQRRS
ncbi:O-antigen ligase family protein [Catellatospora methionotrophica]|uniref:O-antigen ligase family protein n=1 Tax=Catellatospora methionotrophica TaxID=121620 RepID=UPI003409F428